MKDYTGRLVSIAENVAEFLVKEIDHPLEDFSLTELINHAQEFKQVMMTSILDLIRLINEMEGHQLIWENDSSDSYSGILEKIEE